MHSFKIEPAQRHHIPDLHHMIHALSAFHGDIAAAKLEDVQRIFFGKPPTATALVALQDNAVIGYAGLTETMVIHEAAPWIDIHHLFVDEKHRNSGVGTALIKAAKSHALSRGAARLTIGTDPRNASAIAAYRKVPILREKKPGGPRFRVDLTS